MKENKKSLTKSQKNFLDAYEEAQGNVSIACEKSGVRSRTTFYRWLMQEQFVEAMQTKDEHMLDLAEEGLRKKIVEGDTEAIIFFLRAKGKKRGWTLQDEHDINLNQRPQGNPFK